jgi:EAL domain-containing protein (putative c-di-GMP-specific phosphodiesterase class I)
VSIETLLVVDDDPVICEGLAHALGREGRQVVVCRDIESAEIVIDRMPPSHVISDVKLTGPFRFEGLDLLDYIHSHAAGARIVLMTGNLAKGFENEAIRRGVAAVLTKPFSIDELESILGFERNGGSTEPASLVMIPTLDELIDGDDVVPHLQPIVSLDSGEVVAFECLTRLRCSCVLSNPEVLFQYAERKRRVVDLDVACLTRALKIVAPLTRDRLLFANIHPAVFEEGARLYDAIIAAEATLPLRLDRLVLEITEQQPLGDGRAIVPTVERLRERGVRFAFDDLGVAYSHLPLIDQIRPAFLKISQHFGTDFEAIDTREKIVRNLLSLANDFDAQIVLEGIETPATAAAARSMGITLGQGYLFGRPAEAHTFLAVS